MSTRINPFKKFRGLFVPNWLARRTDISQGAKMCYGRLMQFSGRNNRCHPRQELLSAEIGVTERSTRNYIAELEKQKLIESEQRGLRRSNVYYFLDHPWMREDSIDARADQKRQIPSTLERKLHSDPLGSGSEEKNSEEKNPCSPLLGDRVSSSEEVLSAVDEVLDAYPQQVGRIGARRHVTQAIRKFGIKHVLARTRAYAEAVQSQELRFIPYPTRFFREERFNDEPTTWSRHSSGRPNAPPPRQFDPSNYNQRPEDF